MSQTQQILEYMQEHDGITQAEAVSEYGCYRLSGRIYDLKHMGHKILKTMEQQKNRYGKFVSFARYKLIERNTEL